MDETTLANTPGCEDLNLPPKESVRVVHFFGLVEVEPVEPALFGSLQPRATELGPRIGVAASTPMLASNRETQKRGAAKRALDVRACRCLQIATARAGRRRRFKPSDRASTPSPINAAPDFMSGRSRGSRLWTSEPGQRRQTESRTTEWLEVRRDVLRLSDADRKRQERVRVIFIEPDRQHVSAGLEPSGDRARTAQPALCRRRGPRRAPDR